ncbi:MAG: preprotein translocase subunit SecG [Rhodobacteraceae bacterium PARR1]|nr:MAG: preprotein translocase subunit SecG [Rhodobacteraceae bacterium PARR1]
MENVVLTIHLILALLLVGVVLLQRSEGGGLGVGGGNSVMSGRGTATALSKVTWFFAVCFIITSVSLTWMAAVRANSGSVIDTLATPETPADGEGTSLPAPGGNLLPELPSATAPAPAAPATDGAAPAAPSDTAPAPATND